MIERERTLVPYEAENLRGERLLVLAPHPDDEVIACGGLIALHAAEKRSVTVVVVTDGTAADPSNVELRSRREAESRAGVALLAPAATVRFLRLRDRELGAAGEPLRKAVRELLEEIDPDLIAVTSPLEIHPDHAALARVVIDLLQTLSTPSAPLARVAFYEVSQPFRPNTLLDITAVAEQKYNAVRSHQSQVSIRAYDSYARGLNEYRAMTLGAGVTHAEGYWVAPLASFSTTSIAQLELAMSPPRAVQLVRETLPITVLVRTKNRPLLLREALESIRGNTHPASIVVVNDGGARLDLPEAPDLQLIELGTSAGRSEAMNVAARAATTMHLAFLDDDDLLHRDHLATLAEHAATENYIAYYSDAVSVFFERDVEGVLRERDRLRLFGDEFDLQLLALDNYIPLLTLLLKRDDYLSVGGFDPSFDLFEDWDFLLRLARLGSFLHVPKLTCEIRHFPTGDSIMLAATHDLARMREGKQQIWARHSELVTHDTLSHFVERRKRTLERLQVAAASTGGRAAHLALDVERLVREKTLLLDELTEASRRVAAGNDERNALAEQGRQLEVLLRAAEELWRGSEEQLAAANRHRAELQQDQEEKSELLRRLFAEVERQTKMLDQIHASRAWKLHTFMDRVRGRH